MLHKHEFVTKINVSRVQVMRIHLNLLPLKRFLYIINEATILWKNCCMRILEVYFKE